jgi:hypothetical protein
VRFADGSVEDADIVVYCTGYKVTFPFFDPGLIAAPDNDLPLYRTGRLRRLLARAAARRRAGAAGRVRAACRSPGSPFV